jgi:hypothetical protein
MHVGIVLQQITDQTPLFEGFGRWSVRTALGCRMRRTQSDRTEGRLAQNAPHSCRFEVHNRALGSLLICAALMGLGAVAQAQPFPSFFLDTTRHIGRDLYVSDCYVALAASRIGGVVAWGGLGSATHRDRACRLTRSMDVIDTIPIDIVGPWNEFFSRPAVACSDSGHAVAWDGYGGLWLALVSTSGEVVNRVPLDTEDHVDAYSLAFAGRSDRYALVSHGYYSASQADEIRATEVALDGTILRRYTVVRGGPTYPFVSAPDVVRGDSVWLVVWQGQDSLSEHYHINARFVWPDNHSTDTSIFSIRQGVHAFSPKTAFDGENFWVAWLEETTPYAETVAKVARVTQSGAVLDTGGIVVGSEVAGVSLAAARETMLVALSIPGNVIVGIRYDAEARLLDSMPILLSTRAVAEPAVAAAGDTFLVVWRDNVEGVSEATERLAGRRITASGTVVDPSLRDYAFSAGNHDADHVVDAPIIASDGEDFLAVWSNERADPDYSARLLGRRFDNQGRFLDAEPFTITDPSSTPLRPVLTYGADCYFLCWAGSTASYAARISRQGEVMDTVPIPLPSASQFSAFDATFLRDSMYVILGGDTTTLDPLVVRVMADGRVIDSVPRVIKVRWSPEFTNRHPSIASIGDTLVMACRLWDTYNAVLYVAVGLYDRGLKQYDSIWWPPKPNYLNPWRTGVACGGGRILVASDPRNRGTKPELWLLDSAGHLLNDSAIPNPCGWGNNFCIGYDGANFLCAKSGEGFTALPGSRISPDGEVLDKPAVLLAAFDSTLVTGHSGLARDTLGNVGLVFFTFETERYMSDRIRAAVFQRQTGGVEEAMSAERGVTNAGASVVRGLLLLPEAASHRPQAASLLDISGRKVMDLKPGANDVRALAPGVYFVRERLAVGGERSTVHKVVVAR